jgi:RNA methyltransferase, TrmH family
MNPKITSLQNAVVLAAQRLERADERRKQGQFLLEGTHLIQESLAAAWPIDLVFYTDDWASKNHQLLAEFTSQQLYPVADNVLARIATTVKPDGVVGIAKIAPAKSLGLKKMTLGIATERIQNPDNLGSLIRSSAAAGADGIWIDQDSVDPTNPKVLRSSAGQWFRQPPRTVKTITELRKMFPRESLQLLGATSDGKCFWEFDLTKPTFFVLGNEGSGLSPDALAMVDDCVSIPMAMNVESLNVSIAGALLLFEAKRQRQEK